MSNFVKLKKKDLVINVVQSTTMSSVKAMTFWGYDIVVTPCYACIGWCMV